MEISANKPSAGYSDDVTQRIESSQEELDAAWVNGPPAPSPVEVVSYDESWPSAFNELRQLIENSLGNIALSVQHVGSTSVPGLAAKPIIDIDLTVPDSRREEDYLSALESLGFELTVREPNWHEHRMFRHTSPRVNLHVFSSDCPEITRHLIFRDWLRNHPEDLASYAAAKHHAKQQFPDDVRSYTLAKDEVIDQIYARAFGLG